MKKKKVLILSRHPLLKSQMTALWQLFGDYVCVIQEKKPLKTAEEAVKRFREGGFDDIVAIAPLSMIAKMIDLGVKPLWPVLVPCEPDEAEVVRFNRPYRFKEFKRITSVLLTFEDVQPVAK